MPQIAQTPTKSNSAFIEQDPETYVEGALIFWFHSYDARYEERASVHVGKGSQDDFNDAKIWLEPEIEVARPGRTLKRHALGQALKVILDTFALGKWTINKTMRNFFNTMYRACVYTVDC